VDQQPLPPEHVVALHKIFRLHNVDNHLGLQLLHTHYALPPDSIALTMEVEKGVTYTQITPLSTVSVDDIRGQLYFFNEDHKFQAYEYEYGPAVDLPTCFLEDIGKYITENRLEKQVAIGTSIPERPTTEVTLGANATATVTGAKAEARAKELGELRIVGWQFNLGNFEPSPCASHARCHEILPEFDFVKNDVRTFLQGEGYL